MGEECPRTETFENLRPLFLRNRRVWVEEVVVFDELSRPAVLEHD